MELKPKCDMLIDQNKYIGKDPIGHCCLNEATRTDGERFMCEECAESIRKGEGRITIPATGSVKYFTQLCKEYGATIEIIPGDGQ